MRFKTQEQLESYYALIPDKGERKVALNREKQAIKERSLRERLEFNRRGAKRFDWYYGELEKVKV